LHAVWEVLGAGLPRAVTWCQAVWPGQRLSFQPFQTGPWYGRRQGLTGYGATTP
jgi:hypothetical protein